MKLVMAYKMKLVSVLHPFVDTICCIILNFRLNIKFFCKNIF